MRTTIEPPGARRPPSLCVLLDLVLQHRILEPEDILALGAMHGSDHHAVIDACEAAAHARGSAALDERVESCRRMIARTSREEARHAR